jgi:DeoR family transcriptional regulator, suf operon transcriptional repressor
MNSSREKILQTLLAYPRSSINDLAEAVCINGISIRHHLTALEAEKLVTSSEERHGVGRPRLVYSLTGKGVEQFPTNYLRFTHRMLSILEEKLTEDEIQEILEAMSLLAVEKYRDALKDEAIEKRLDHLQALLLKEGFIIKWEKKDNVYRLMILSCPYYHIGKKHPEICHFDHTLISKLLDVPVIIEKCILKEDTRCILKLDI